MSHLNSGRLNLASLRDLSRTEFLGLLDDIDGTKSIVWDQKLITPFNLVSDYSLLKGHGVVQGLELRAGQLPPIKAQNVVYLVQPILSYMDIIVGKFDDDANFRFSRRLTMIFL